MTKYQPVAIIPHYNHHSTVTDVVRSLLDLGLPVLVVDDGSTRESHIVLQQVAQWANVQVIYRPQNGGKGATVKTGLIELLQQGFSHAIQVDADGQHNLADVITMLALSKTQPNAVICGNPIYTQDAPKIRLYGRKITNFWIKINTLSRNIPDGMCGFRIYPLAETVTLCHQEHIGEHMDFDIEILVRMHWRQIPMVWVNTTVTYPPGGISHFHALRDNWLISKMHARLFWGMLVRKLMGRQV